MQKKNYWWLLPGLLALGPVAIALVYLAHALQVPVYRFEFKNYNESYAVFILAIILAALVMRTIWQRSHLYLLLGGFALVALLREIHFEWTGKGVYFMLLILILLAWQWREQLKPLAQSGNFLPWFKGTMAMYFLSVIISRRVFRGILPDEELLHVALEEFLENVAHSMLMITAMLGSWRRPVTPATQKGDNHSA